LSCYERAIPQHCNREFFLGGFLDLVVTPSQQNVVYGGGEPAEDYHEYSERRQVFNNVHGRYEVLEDEEGLGHRIEEKLEVCGSFDSMLVPTIKSLPSLCFFPRNSTLQELFI
jgi:hypothetical protein